MQLKEFDLLRGQVRVVVNFVDDDGQELARFEQFDPAQPAAGACTRLCAARGVSMSSCRICLSEFFVAPRA